MVQHIALTVNDSKEIESFYKDVLLFHIHHKFSIDRNVIKQIFNVEELTDVYVLNRHDIQFEIFISSKKESKVFSHICLIYPKAEITYKKAVQTGYKALVKKNSANNTYFIWDKSGNMFEIKDTTEYN